MLIKLPAIINIKIPLIKITIHKLAIPKIHCKKITFE